MSEEPLYGLQLFTSYKVLLLEQSSEVVHGRMPLLKDVWPEIICLLYA